MEVIIIHFKNYVKLNNNLMIIKINFKNKGLTLIEALIWFAIFAAVVAGVFALYSSYRNASNASTVNKESSTIFSQTEQLFASDDTAALTNAIGLQLGIFPSTVKVNGAVINNVYGGTITLTGQSSIGFTLIYTNIPYGEVCSNIVRAQKAVGWDAGNGVSYNQSYTIAKIAASCGNNGQGSKAITFVRTTI